MASRINIRIDEKLKADAEKVVALEGMKSLTEYIVKLIRQDSERLLELHSKIVLEDNVFDRFMKACEDAEKPNAALLEAAKFTDQSRFR